MGIPNKAFVEAAKRIGFDKASKIWVTSLPILAKSSDQEFADLATITYRVTGDLFGVDSRKAIQGAWETVGIYLQLQDS
jgi:Zn-dependent metalloprotease